MKLLISYIKQIWTSSIRRQLMLGIILVHAVLMSIFVYDLVDRQTQFLHLQSMEQSRSLAKTLAANSTSWVLANDVIGLEETINALSDYPSLHYAMVVSPDGRVLGHTQLDKVGLYIHDAISGGLLKGKREQTVLIDNDVSIDVASPIVSSGTFVGWARVNLSQKNNAAGLDVITRDGIFYTLLAVFIGSLFAFFMAKGITLGLNNIVHVVDGIENGNQQLRANIKRHDEIGKLGQGFNRMLDTIAKSKADFQAVMDNSPSVIYAKDKEGRYLFINKQWANLFDAENKGIVGKTDHEIFEKDFADQFVENDVAVLTSGTELNIEEVAPHGDVLHTYHTVKFPLRDDERNIYAVCGISTDITDRREAEKEKLSLEQQLRHTQKMQAIGQLTGGIAHDFNNLLAVILGYAELIKDRADLDKASLTDYVNQILAAGTRGRKLIEQMMIYSRKDQSNSEVEPMNIEDILLDATKMLKATIPTSIQVETSFQKDIPYINSNAGLISQVFLNLCMNAKDSMEEGGKLLISLEVEKYNNSACTSCGEFFTGEYVVISIIDSGTGISMNTAERMFEPFYTSKKLGEGTGMGLSVVHGIVHKLGGHIIVRSKVSEGSSFKVLLPISDETVEIKSLEKKIENEYDFSGLRIMVIDDEPAIATLLEESLKQFNADVDVFTSSLDALAFFEKQPEKFNLILTDQTMPNLSGVLLSEKLLALRPDINIILCTGYSKEVTEESALAMGIKSFMNKPIDIVKLYNIINGLR